MILTPFLGKETLVTIIPTIVNASESALARFSPLERQCYTDQVSLQQHLKLFKISLLTDIFTFTNAPV